MPVNVSNRPLSLLVLVAASLLPAAARRLCDRLIRDFDDYEMDVARFRAARRELLRQFDP